jgi:beta-lactam-binding protein with PASTA domain
VDDDLVTVPDVVGMPFHIARDLASDAGVALANPDPDGPPISSLAWPGLFYVTSQSPPPGTRVRRWDSVRIEVLEFRPEGRPPESGPRGNRS